MIDILNYHACTHTPDSPERGEITAISQWLIKNGTKNVIWAGDMNLNINDIAFENILAEGYTSVINGEKTSLKKKCKEGNYFSKGEDNVLFKLVDLKFRSVKVLDFMVGKDCNLVSVLRAMFRQHSCLISSSSMSLTIARETFVSSFNVRL